MNHWKNILADHRVFPTQLKSQKSHVNLARILTFARGCARIIDAEITSKSKVIPKKKERR